MVVAATLVVAASLGPAAVAPAPAGAVGGAAEVEMEWTFWCELNQLRLSKGLVPLPQSTGMRQMAREWSQYISQFGPSGPKPHRPNLGSATQSYTGAPWSAVAENLVWGPVWTDPAVVAAQGHDALAASPVHYANMTNPGWEYVGIGVHAGSNYYGTQNFLSTTSSSVATTMPPGQHFIDVCSTHPFFDEIEWMYDEGISTGTETSRYTIYNYGTPVSRSAMAAFLYRLSGTPPHVPPPLSPFSDMHLLSPFYLEVTWMVAEGITTGYPDGTFRPTSRVSREAMAAFMYRLAEPSETSWTIPTTPSFPDVPLDHAFFTEIEWAVFAGITNGYGDGEYKPGVPVSRQAMAAFMQRLDAVLT